MSDVSFSAPGLEDDEVAPSTPSSQRSILSALREELEKPPVFEKEATIKVPGHTNIELKVSTDLPLSKLDRIQRGSYTDKKKTKLDVALFNARLISAQTIGLLVNGEDSELTFHDEDVQTWLKSMDPAGAVQALYPRDADLVDAGGEVMSAAGYGDNDDDEDDDNDPLD